MGLSVRNTVDSIKFYPRPMNLWRVLNLFKKLQLKFKAKNKTKVKIQKSIFDDKNHFLFIYMGHLLIYLWLKLVHVRLVIDNLDMDVFSRYKPLFSTKCHIT